MMSRSSLLGSALAAFLLSLGAAACTPTGAAVSAGATAGVAAAQERGLQGALTDSRLRFELNHLLLQESEELYRHIKFQIQEGRVLLTGNVRRPEDRIAVARLTWQPPGVREVINRIEITDRSSLTNFARDELISAELEAKLLFDSAVNSINYSIETQNQVIYLIGLARDDRELERVVAHAKTIAYVRRVVSHVLLRDDPARRAPAVS